MLLISILICKKEKYVIRKIKKKIKKIKKWKKYNNNNYNYNKNINQIPTTNIPLNPIFNMTNEEIRKTKEFISRNVAFTMTGQNFNIFHTHHDNYSRYCEPFDIAQLHGNNYVTGTGIRTFLHSVQEFNQNSTCIIQTPDVFAGLWDHENKTYRFRSGQEFPNSNHLENDIIFPIHVPGHWILGVIRCHNTLREIIIIDPLGNKQKERGDVLLRWLEDEHLLRNKNFIRNEWNIYYNRNNLPRQRDGTECGVFVSMFAFHYIVFKKHPTTSDWDTPMLPKLRLFIAYQIFRLLEHHLALHNRLPYFHTELIDLINDNDEEHPFNDKARCKEDYHEVNPKKITNESYINVDEEFQNIQEVIFKSINEIIALKLSSNKEKI